MNHDAPIINEAYCSYVRALRRLHELEIAGQQQSPEAADLESALEAAWEPLTPEQRESVAGLGSDLNWIRRGLPPRGVQKEQITDSDRESLAQAIATGSPHEALRRLRHCAAVIPATELAYLRGNAWLRLEEYETALLFYRHAKKLTPGDRDFAFIEFYCLSFVDPTAAFERAKAILGAEGRQAVAGPATSPT